jgi:selenocysteine-specific elongation factor
MGTAGHVDHGKTSLISALTGIDCDTHAEEKRRGITINLGFAHIVLPFGCSVGIIDVPGHRDFVHTMISGVSGIDFVCFVIAANEGVMPQTREHLAIMEMLGVKHGVIALTKSDIVDAEMLELVKTDILGLCKNSFLKTAAIVPVSAKTRHGLDTLLREFDAVVDAMGVRHAKENFRLYIDRAFSIAGFGTVVTGTVLDGTLAENDSVYLLPGTKQFRVRRLERHGEQVSTIVAGDRASINLVGLNREDISHGMLLSNAPLHDSLILDVSLSLYAQSPDLSAHAKAFFLTQTTDLLADIHLLSGNTLKAGSTGFAQVRVPQACVCQAGDRFVIRSSSQDKTLGGGIILDVSPLHHRRRSEKVLAHVSQLDPQKVSTLVAGEVYKQQTAQSHRDIATALNRGVNEIFNAIKTGMPEDIAVIADKAMLFCIPSIKSTEFKKLILSTIAAHHTQFPLDPHGVPVEEIAGLIGSNTSLDGAAFVRLLLEQMTAAGQLRRVAHTYVLACHSVSADSAKQKQIDVVSTFLRSCRMNAPLQSDLHDCAVRSGISQQELTGILKYLVSNKKAYLTEGTWLSAEVVDAIRITLLQKLAVTPDGLTVAQFRDCIGANRKLCLLLYGLFDTEGVTTRVGDVRVITEKGMQFLKEHSL